MDPLPASQRAIGTDEQNLHDWLDPLIDEMTITGEFESLRELDGIKGREACRHVMI
ncbi:hypothetical protein [Siminovitchia sediminis]